MRHASHSPFEFALSANPRHLRGQGGLLSINSNANDLARNHQADRTNEKLPIMEGAGNYQSFLEELPAKYGIIIRKSVSCSSFPMMAKTLKILEIAAILPEIAREELASTEFNMRKLTSLHPLKRDLCICWNKRRAKMNPTLHKFGHSLSKLVKNS